MPLPSSSRAQGSRAMRRLPRRRNATLLALLGVACLVGLPARVVAQSTPSLVALEGDPAPGTGGAPFLELGPPVVNDAGEIAFEASYELGGGQTGFGIFLASEGGIDALALQGDVAPGTGGGTFFGFFDPALNASGQVAFVGTIVGGTGPPQGVFLADGGTVTALALAFEPAADSGGGSFASFQSPIGLTDAGEAIVTSGLLGGTIGQAVYGLASTSDRRILALGDPAPAPLIGTYALLGTPGVSGSGRIVLPVAVQTASFLFGLAGIETSGTPTLVALEGSVAPETGGGTFDLFDLTRPAINDDGTVAFQASLAGGSVGTGLFVVDGAVTAAAALPGDAAPDTGGGTYDQLVTSPTLDDAGRVAFRGPLFGAGAGEGLFRDVFGVDEAIAITGDAAPGVSGSVFDEFPAAPAQSPGGRIAFDATTSGATAASGIWTVPEPGMAAMLGAGSLLLAGCGVRRAGRRPTPRPFAGTD